MNSSPFDINSYVIAMLALNLAVSAANLSYNVLTSCKKSKNGSTPIVKSPIPGSPAVEFNNSINRLTEP
jgi:hypothetical protein